jgi:hypothetical protein
MIRTLAEFKRAIHTGMEIECEGIEQRAWSNERSTYAGESYAAPIPEMMKGARYVSHVDTTGFYLKSPEDKTKRGSFCAWPKKADLEYRRDTFTIADRHRDGQIYQKRHYRITVK